MTDPKITRRQLLLTTSTVALAGMVSTEVSAAALDDKSPLTFLDSLLSAEEVAIAERELSPHRPNTLKLDLVWEWRGELHSRIAQGADIIAVTRWDKALLLRELAREATFSLRQHRLASSLFRTEISREALRA